MFLLQNQRTCSNNQSPCWERPGLPLRWPVQPPCPGLEIPSLLPNVLVSLPLDMKGRTVPSHPSPHTCNQLRDQHSVALSCKIRLEGEKSE